MKHLKSYKLFESEFFDNDYIDSLLDRISDSGIDSLSDIEKNQLKLFSEDDKEIIETIEKMGDLTIKFKEINAEMRRCQDSGESDGFHLMKDWMKLNKELRPLEQSFRKWGIELGDPRLDKLMRKIRPDAYNNVFESVIAGQKDGFINQNILSDVEDILLELEDMGIECRMWTNDYRGGGSKFHQTDELYRLDVEINYDNDDVTKEYEIKNTVKSVVDRLKDYFKKNGGRVRKTYEDKDFLELSINIYR